MDPATLVEVKLAEGQRLVEQLVKDGFDVTAAFWLKADENNHWHLYVASKAVEEMGVIAAYRALHTTLSGMPDLGLGLFRVKLIGASAPLARAVLVVRGRHRGNVIIPYWGRPLGDLSVEGAYVYPPVDSMNMDDGGAIAAHAKAKAYKGNLVATIGTGETAPPVVPPEPEDGPKDLDDLASMATPPNPPAVPPASGDEVR